MEYLEMLSIPLTPSFVRIIVSIVLTVDGEFGGEQQITTVKNLPRALTIACGAGSAE